LEIKGLPPGETATLLLMRAAGENCSASVARAIAPPADGLVEIATHVQEGCWCRVTGRVPGEPQAGLAVLARGRASAYIGPQDLCGRRGPIQVEMRPRPEVRVVVHPASAKMAAFARDDLAHADLVFDRQQTGITLRPRFLPPALFVGLNCGTVDKHPALVRGEINVYYGVPQENTSCGGTSAVLIHDEPVLGDAVHELSHKLGLDRGDHERGAAFAEGHTNLQEGFGCNNVMWTLTDVLQDQISPGQAFWLSHSCSSFAAQQGPCLVCGQNVGDSSPCPPFSLGQNPARATCDACTLEQLQGRAVNTGGRNQFCDRATLRAALLQRHAELAKHAAENPQLPLGHPRRAKFVARWAERIKTVLAVETVARSEGEQRARGLQYLGQLADGVSPARRQYLLYSADRIRRITPEKPYRPRCGTSPANQ